MHKRKFMWLLSLLLCASWQDNASKLLLALMESRHDSENAERILINLRPRELVSSIKVRRVKDPQLKI